MDGAKFIIKKWQLPIGMGCKPTWATDRKPPALTLLASRCLATLSAIQPLLIKHEDNRQKHPSSRTTSTNYIKEMLKNRVGARSCARNRMQHLEVAIQGWYKSDVLGNAGMFHRLEHHTTFLNRRHRRSILDVAYDCYSSTEGPTSALQLQWA